MFNFKYVDNSLSLHVTGDVENKIGEEDEDEIFGMEKESSLTTEHD